MTVSRVERHQTHPQRQTWARLARALETTVDHLLTGRRPNETPPDDALTDRLLTLWRALPAEDRAAGIEALEYVVKMSAQVQQLRARVATYEQRERTDSAALRDAERRARAAERAAAAARRTAAERTNPGLTRQTQKAG